MVFLLSLDIFNQVFVILVARTFVDSVIGRWLLLGGVGHFFQSLKVEVALPVIKVFLEVEVVGEPGAGERFTGIALAPGRASSD